MYDACSLSITATSLVQAIFSDLCSVTDVPEELGPLASAEGVSGMASRLAAARCLLVQQQNRLPRGIGFREVG